MDPSLMSSACVHFAHYINTLRYRIVCWKLIGHSSKHIIIILYCCPCNFLNDVHREIGNESHAHECVARENFARQQFHWNWRHKWRASLQAREIMKCALNMVPNICILCSCYCAMCVEDVVYTQFCAYVWLHVIFASSTVLHTMQIARTLAKCQ